MGEYRILEPAAYPVLDSTRPVRDTGELACGMIRVIQGDHAEWVAERHLWPWDEPVPTEY